MALQTLTTTASTTASGDAQPAATSSSGNSGGGGILSTTAASSLYLYTFLATLILLLAVSAAVIMRSIAIRRRQRRAIEDSIRNGTYVSPEQRRRRRHERPKLFEATLHDFDNTMEKWAGVVPVTAAVAQSALPGPTTRIVRQRRARYRRLYCLDIDPWEFFSGGRPGDTVGRDYITEVVQPELKEVPLNVSVLIAMPTPQRTELKGSYKVSSDAEPEVPVVEFGVARLTVVPGTKPKSDDVSAIASSSSGHENDSPV